MLAEAFIFANGSYSQGIPPLPQNNGPLSASASHHLPCIPMGVARRPSHRVRAGTQGVGTPSAAAHAQYLWDYEYSYWMPVSLFYEL